MALGAGDAGGAAATLPGARSLVTAGFHRLADFAQFRDPEVAMLRDCVSRVPWFTQALADRTAGYLTPRLRAAGLDGEVSRPDLAHWLAQSSVGPFDEEFAGHVRGLTHIEGGATFPGVGVPMPAQMIVAAMAWLQGQILVDLGDVSDTITLSGLGGIWMDQLILQLGIMLEPFIGDPPSPRAYGGGDHEAALHPYADLAGFGPDEGRVMEETGALLAPLASGVISLAYSYLLSRPESAGYFEDAHHLAERKRTLMDWWVRTTSDPHDAGAELGAYLRKVANAHVRNAGSYPQVGIPAQLTIALMAWVEMRVMTALNTIHVVDGGSSAIFGLFGDPAAVARLGKAWMAMLTLQLGVLIDPYLVATPTR